MTVKSVKLQRDGDRDFTNCTSLYVQSVPAARLCQILSVSELSGNWVNSTVPDVEVSYSKFSV